MGTMTHVKICGITNIEDAELCCEAGADALGLNFYPPSVRHISVESAQAIAAAVRGRALLIGVFVNENEGRVRSIRDTVGLDCVQFHGDEAPELVSRFLPHAYRAFRVRGPEILEQVRAYPGEHVLLDAYVPDMPGGSGARFDWSLATRVAEERRLTLAGGLTPDNVAAAVAQVQPFCVDVASGVERVKGRKDPDLVRAFITNAKAAGNPDMSAPRARPSH